MLNRRDLLRNGFRDAARAFSHGARAVGQVLAPSPARPLTSVVRPPGALDEQRFLSACTRCNDCLLACPKQAVRKAGPELGPELSGTPVIVPGEQPCWMCEDMPCIEACSEGALVPLARVTDARLGTVRVVEDACYAAQGSICEACVERCPVRPRPIRVERGAAPVLDDGCTGCGVCAWFCPPRAIEIVPRREGRRAQPAGVGVPS